MKTTEEILKQQYITARDLQKLIPGMSYVAALKKINEFIEIETKELGYLNPSGKTKVALTWLVKKRLGMKWGKKNDKE